MTRDVLSCFISSIEIERVFSLTRRVCTWDRAQLDADSIEQIMLLKYYNRIMNLKLNETLIESWDIIRREEDIDREIDENVDSFAVTFKHTLEDLNL